MSSGSSVTSSPARSATVMTLSSSSVGVGLGEDFHFPADLISIQDRKDEALQVLKSDLMGKLSKEVKSLDEDSWMFDGPRSRIHLISGKGALRDRRTELSTYHSMSAKK
ncbi:protein SAMBA isoform X1 [Primulina eburnea]|uniref:protein SAMBA isoform X1 n=1 Tax=Primulina eburnea TaxID=1245227 RepID=UPI003C6C4FF7